MTKQQKKEFDNLYNFSNSIEYENIEEEYIENEKIKKKEREKRIKQKKNNKKSQFDFDTETVIGMTNRNNKKIKQEKERKNFKKQSRLNRKQKRIRKLIKLGMLLLIIIGGVVFTLVSPLFNITDISVNNNIQISAESIISLSQLQKGQNIFKFNKNKVIEDIKTNPYVESVKIIRKIPNKIEISINEREKKFNVEFLNGYIYINSQGYILEISEKKEALPVIQGISTSQEDIVEGNRLNIQDLNRLETIIQIIDICKDYEIEKKVAKIDISDKNDYILYMEEEKKTIHLGDETNLSNKMLYVTTIMNENKDKEGIIYVNGDINGNFKPRFRESV